MSAGAPKMMNLAYSGGFLDRASDRRSDPGCIAMLLAAPQTRLIPIWQDSCMVSGDPPAPVTALDDGRRPLVREAGTPLFLGLDGDTGLFAVDLSALDQERAVEIAGLVSAVPGPGGVPTRQPIHVRRVMEDGPFDAADMDTYVRTGAGPAR